MPHGQQTVDSQPVDPKDPESLSLVPSARVASHKDLTDDVSEVSSLGEEDMKDPLAYQPTQVRESPVHSLRITDLLFLSTLCLNRKECLSCALSVC